MKLDRFDWFVIGLVLTAVISFFAYPYYLDIEIKNYELNLPSKCYTNLTPAAYFTEPPSPMIIDNNSFTIEGPDKIHLARTEGTGSMNPLMRKDSILLFVYPKKVDIGDILIYKNGNHSVVHRVSNITDDGFILKGDNNERADGGIIKEDMIVGKVVGILW